MIRKMVMGLTVVIALLCCLLVACGETNVIDNTGNTDKNETPEIPVVYTVTFMVDGEEFYNINVNYGDKINAPTNEPIKKADSNNEYLFDGWYNGESRWDFENDSVKQNVVLEAKFKATVTYSEEFLPSED